MLVNIHNEEHRKIIEHSIIPNYQTQDRFFNLSPYLVELFLNSSYK